MEVKLMAKGGVLLTNELRSFVDEKLKKLEALLDPADTTALADIELRTVTAGQRTGNIFRAEVNLQYASGFVRAESVQDTLHAALDEAVDEARRELRKEKGKRRDLMRRGAAKIKDFLRTFGR